MLPQHPPPQVLLWLAWLLIALFLVVTIAAVTVHIPETVRCPFVLVPENGADPIQSPLVAVVQSVNVTEGQQIQAGTLLFQLRSDDIRTWQTQLETAREDSRALEKRMTKSEEYFVAEIGIKNEELTQVEKEVAFREKHLATSRDFLERNEKLAAEKLVSQVELLRYKLDTAQSEKDLNVAQRTVQQVTLQRQELETTRARQRSEDESSVEKLKLRIAALQRQLENCSGDVMEIRAPYQAVVISLARRNSGGVVHNGDELCQLARLEGQPRARLSVAEAGLPKLAPGQKARLFFEAFPYQRYGTLTARLQWISPAAISYADTQLASEHTSGLAAPERGAGGSFTARATLDQTAFHSRDHDRPVAVGMKGEARVVVGSRTLAEYVLEPIRQLREQTRQ
jgi:multidrug efflux pump subunit AcrA (membrane-fusion protein)